MFHVFVYMLLSAPILIYAQTYDEYGFDADGTCASEYNPTLNFTLLSASSDVCTGDVQACTIADKCTPNDCFKNCTKLYFEELQRIGDFCKGPTLTHISYSDRPCLEEDEGPLDKSCQRYCTERSINNKAFRCKLWSSGSQECECYDDVFTSCGVSTYFSDPRGSYIYADIKPVGFYFKEDGGCFCAKSRDDCGGGSYKKYGNVCTYTGFNDAGYNFRGFDSNSIHKDTQTIYDNEGYDVNGFNADGRDKDGYDVNGFNTYGRDIEGYDVNGFNVGGRDRDGYDRNGYDINGRNATFYNKDGVYMPLQKPIPWYVSDGDDCNVEGERIHLKGICEEGIQDLGLPYTSGYNLKYLGYPPSLNFYEGVVGCSMRVEGYDSNGMFTHPYRWWITPKTNPSPGSETKSFIYETYETYPCHGKSKKIMVNDKIVYAIGRNKCICKNRQCPPNTYQDETGQQNCKACPPGRYSNAGSGNCPFTSSENSAAYEAGIVSKADEKAGALQDKYNELIPRFDDGWTQQNLSQATLDGYSDGIQSDVTKHCERMRDEFKSRWNKQSCTKSDLSEM